MPYGVYQGAANGSIDWTTADMRVILVNSDYTYSSNHTVVSNILSAVLGQGCGNVVLGSAAISFAEGSGEVQFDGGDSTFTSLPAGDTPAKAIVYEYNASNAAALLACCCNLTSPAVPNGGNYTIQWASGGIYAIDMQV